MNATRTRRCPMCERATAAANCCGIDLTVRRRRFRMTPKLCQLVHVAAARKGLDDDTYRLRLRARGVESSKHFDRDTFKAFMSDLAALPDAPVRRARG